MTENEIFLFKLFEIMINYYYHCILKNKNLNNNPDSVGGIGLSNVVRRLDLLYPGDYNLDIRDEKDTYSCELSLVL